MRQISSRDRRNQSLYTNQYVRFTKALAFLDQRDYYAFVQAVTLKVDFDCIVGDNIKRLVVKEIRLKLYS